ncbi:MAG: choice-of-anchor U domain-containing protein, partial [Desulfococcaceae bacterium]
MFSTVGVDPDDLNGDGIPDDQEVDDPTAVFPDLDPTDPLILFVRAAMGDGYWAVQGLDNVVEMIALKAYTTDAEGVTVPPGTEMPLGVIGYKLETFAPGDEAKVRVYFNPAAPENSAWYSFAWVEGWQEFSGSTAVFGDDMSYVTLTLRDGGIGDADGIENGIIIIPLSGFGVGIESDGGGSDTCFIESMKPARGNWNLLPLAVLLTGVAGYFCRGIRRK